MAKARTAARSVWARITGTSEAGAPDPRQRQYSILVLCAVVVTTALGWYWDMTTPALIAALTAVLALTATGGQALRSDLRRFSWFVPALVAVMAAGPVLREIPAAAGTLVAVVVFGTSMLPALGEHHRVAGQTFAAATLVATSGVGRDQPWWTVLAAALAGALFALTLRVVIGLSDRTRASRLAVANTLRETGPGVLEQAVSMWRADGASAWLGEVLAGAARFRAARETLLVQAQRSDATEATRLRGIVEEADLVAAELARAVRSRACTGLPPLARRDPSRAAVVQDRARTLPEAVRGVNEGFDRIRAAVVRRTETPVRAPMVSTVRDRIADATRAHLSVRSSLFRHALRCALAATIGMVIVALLGDPSASTLLLALYLVLQPAARDSMTGALERTGAAVLAVTALAVLITLVPATLLLGPIVVAGMFLFIDQLRSNYQALLACLVAVTVLEQAFMLERPLINVGISFAANTAVGAAIALVVGFISYLVLPSSTLPDARGAVRKTVLAVTDLLRAVRGPTRAGDRTADPAAGDWRGAHVVALRSTQDLLGMPAMLDGAEEHEPADTATAEAAIALNALRQDLAVLATHPAEQRSVAAPALSAVDDLLAGEAQTRIPDVPAGNAPVSEMFAGSALENALRARLAVDRALGKDAPWKSYSVALFHSDTHSEQLRIR